jgi:diacylglycerol kinase (ATP)
MNRTCIILNPAAKSERARGFKEKVRHLAQGVTIKFTECPGDAEAQAERAVEQGYKTIVAAGGDGTINEVVNGLDGADVTLGILPIGSVNVFSMELGIPNKIEKAWQVILAGKTREVDLASANDHRFVQLAGVGLDAQIVERTEWESKKLLGPLSYILTGAQMMAEKPPRIVVTPEEGKPRVGSFVLIGNGRLYGGPFPIFKEAVLDDGLLDVCVFEQMSPFAMARYFQAILTGSHLKLKDVHYFKSRRVRVEADEKVPMEVDGELLGYLPCEFSVKRGGLRVLVP